MSNEEQRAREAIFSALQTVTITVRPAIAGEVQAVFDDMRPGLTETILSALLTQGLLKRSG